MKLPLSGFFLLLCALVTLPGCLSHVKLGGVVITVTEIKAVSPTEMVATLKYTNENVVPIGVTSGEYTLYIDGKSTAHSVSMKPVGMPQLSTVAQQVTFKYTNVAHLRSVLNTQAAHAVSYKLQGTLHVYAGEDKVDISTSDSGTVDLRPLEGKL